MWSAGRRLGAVAHVAGSMQAESSRAAQSRADDKRQQRAAVGAGASARRESWWRGSTGASGQQNVACRLSPVAWWEAGRTAVHLLAASNSYGGCIQLTRRLQDGPKLRPSLRVALHTNPRRTAISSTASDGSALCLCYRSWDPIPSNPGIATACGGVLAHWQCCRARTVGLDAAQITGDSLSKCIAEPACAIAISHCRLLRILDIGCCLLSAVCSVSGEGGNGSPSSPSSSCSKSRATPLELFVPRGLIIHPTTSRGLQHNTIPRHQIPFPS